MLFCPAYTLITLLASSPRAGGGIAVGDTGGRCIGGIVVRKFRHLDYNDRLRIEALIKIGASKSEIAQIIGCALSTVYVELRRGQYTRLDKQYRWIQAYSADIAQKDYDYKASNKGAPIKLGKDLSYSSRIV